MKENEQKVMDVLEKVMDVLKENEQKVMDVLKENEQKTDIRLEKVMDVLVPLQIAVGILQGNKK